MSEPKEEVVVAEPAGDFDKQADSFYAEKDKVAPEDDSSPSKEDQSKEAEDLKPEGDDPLKTSEKVEEEAADENGKKDPRDLMFRKGYNEAKTKLDPMIKELETLRPQLDEFRKVTSTPEYIRFNMKQQGFTEEAIDAKLTEMGHKVEAKQEAGLDLVLNRLGVDISKLDDSGKQYVNTYIADAVKVFDVLLQDRLGKVLPNQLGPIQDTIASMTQSKSAGDLMDKMEETITSEGVLDFEKDVLPQVEKFMDENPKATQSDVIRHFEILNHKLSLERMKLGGRKEARDASKKDLRSQKEGSKVSLAGIKKTGNFDKDADAILDAFGNNN
jgi:hypothetical protein